ncbi:Aim23p Ecym_5205 [Eremothecium cymbalariae DBVPG|uniref:Altered inheritance of mitochondria protein 23, mitochondrial n=1 Tax=Eremothecium cymbalariae (strain CBS 270.75 / DBVPG 7215 / KCTC 17166 / NRRL Y-17582) TaxID=931890 RepID=I6ND32_ERECY|nr:hypothetical protein Ecym_5205 [Eremothecium cymbalariae DBVPG\
MFTLRSCQSLILRGSANYVRHITNVQTLWKDIPSATMNSALFNYVRALDNDPKNNNRQQKHRNRDSRNRPPLNGVNRKKNLVVKWSTGSKRAQEAANSTLSEILKIRPDGNVKAIDTQSNVVSLVNIRELIKGIDLDKEGFIILKVEEDDQGALVPLVKMLPAKTVTNAYADKLAKDKGIELLKLGVNRSRIGHSTPKDGSNSDTKCVKVSWQISDRDLAKQKANEIMSQVKKGLKVTIILDNKESMNMDPIMKEESQDTSKAAATTRLSEEEREERLIIIEQLKQILYTNPVRIKVEGSIRNRMTVKVIPKGSSFDCKEDKRALKEQRKREKQEKLRRRIEKKLLRKADG